jgi:ABC-type Mn2+/Zn2+ transport system permease subunit
MNLNYAVPVPAVHSSLPSPVELLELPFMRTALAELLLLAVAGGVLGGWIVLRSLAFFSHAVGTATFPGLVVAEAAGLSPKLAGLAVAAGYAGGVERAGRSGRDRGDVATALLLVVALAGGIVLASDVFDSGADVDRLLFGTLIGLDGGDVAFSAGAAVLAVATALTLGRTWVAAGFDPETTTVLGPRAVRADAVLFGIVATAIVAALPAVGALLVTSIFVVPAATARLYARSVGALVRWSVALAAAEGVAGLYLAFWLDIPPGPAVATLASSVYALAALAPRLSPRPGES